MAKRIAHRTTIDGTLTLIYPDEIMLIFPAEEDAESTYANMFISKETRILDVHEFLSRFNLVEYSGFILNTWAKVRKEAGITKV